MNTKAKYNFIKIAVASAAVTLCSGALFAHPTQPKVANADSQALSAAEQLILPTDYEQYLPLSSPTDVAVCDDFTAIADGNVIYVYNRNENVYRKYEHNANVPEFNTVANLEFSANCDLYFLDGNALMYMIEWETLSSISEPIVTKADFPTFFCNAFILQGEDLYFAVSSESSAHLSRTTLGAPNASTATPIVSNLSKGPAIAYYDGTLYYTDSNGYFLHKISLEENSEPTEVCAFPSAISSLAVNGDEIFISNDKNDFYVYNRITLNGTATNVQPIAQDSQGSYKAICSHEEYVYVIRDRSVRQYEVGKGFTDYEISADSASPHRLQGATNVTLYADKLYIADGGNNRISVYDSKANGYATYATPAPASFIAAQGNTILAANDSHAWLIDTNAPEADPQSFRGFQGNLIGAVAVHGTYYLVTANNVYYSIAYLPSQGENGESGEEYAWQLTDGIQKTNQISPGLLATDVYGNLYVAAGNDVYKIRESEIFTADAYGAEILSHLPANPEKLTVDLNENVYVLKEGIIHAYAYDSQKDEYASNAAQTSLAAQLVYGQTDETLVNSFAMDVCENKTYVLYAGNFIASTDRLQLPTVKTITTEQLEQQVFADGNAEFKVVETAANAFLIEFDLALWNEFCLQGGQPYFPYLSHGRRTQSATALLLGTAGEYSVLAIFNRESHKYENYLTKTRYYVTEKAENEYLVTYSTQEEKTGYLTNAVTLYKYPYLTPLLQVTELTKNQAVTLIGEVTDLDYSYYKIRFTDENGTEQIGFIPQGYINLFDGTPNPSETTTYRETAPNKDSARRLLFLLLGAGAVCILTNLLLLHRRNKDE